MSLLSPAARTNSRYAKRERAALAGDALPHHDLLRGVPFLLLANHGDAHRLVEAVGENFDFLLLEAGRFQL